MKKNILAVLILALSIVNIVLSALMIFTVIPTMKKTSKLIDRIASIVDLELETPEGKKEDLSVADIETLAFDEATDKFTCALKKAEGSSDPHYAIFYLSLYINKKNPDTKELQPYIASNKSKIKEIVTEEFSKYTIDEVSANMDTIKENVKKNIQNLFKSEFIVDISFGNIVTQ